MGKSKISWTEKTWNPVVGCTRVSDGCRLCYAYELHDRRHKAWKDGRWPTAPAQYHQPFREVQVLDVHRMTQPFRWKKPSRIFVCSMADLFHADVPDSTVEQVYGVMATNPHHEFYVLTKRPERMSEFVNERWPVPLENVVHGISAENQTTYDARMPILYRMPSARRFLSIEPLLGSIDLCFRQHAPENLPHWLIVGGESGSGFREMEVGVLRSIVEQALEFEVNVHVKQDSGNLPGKQGLIPDSLWRFKDGPLPLQSRGP